MKKIFTNIPNNERSDSTSTVAALLQQLIPFRGQGITAISQIISHHALRNNKWTDDTSFQSYFQAQQGSVLHGGDMPQKHLDDFWGDACSLLVELFDLRRRLQLETLDICTRVTAAL